MLRHVERLLLLFVVVMTLMAVSLRDADAADKLVVEPLPLGSVMREIVMSHPSVQEAIHVYESVQHEVESAKGGYKPTIGTEASVGQQYNKGVSSNEETRNLTASTAGVYAKQNLFDGFGTENYVGETKARMLAAAYEALNTANSVFVQTAEAYIGVLRERELLMLSEKNVYTQAQILEQIKEKTDAGFGRKSDLLNSQARLALARANVISQQQNLKQAVVKLHKQIGRFIDPRRLVDPEIGNEFGFDVEDFVNFAFRNYPALEVAKYNVIVKKYAMKRTQARYYPTLDAEVRADYSNNTGGDEGDNKSMSAMLYLNYELYDGGRRSADKKKNYSDILKEHERVYIERRNLNEAVRLAWNIKQSEDSKYTFLEEHVKLSQATLDAFKEEYQLGRRTLVELLDMENEHQAAVDAFVESKYAAMVAYFRLRYVAGSLLYEYKTDLFSKVGLENEVDNFEKLEDFQKLENNKDEDNTVDTKDQCDNSVFNTETGRYGCAGDESVTVGYIKPQDIEDYIKSSAGDSLTLEDNDTGLGEPESLGEPEGLGEPETLGEVEAVGGAESAAIVEPIKPEPKTVMDIKDNVSYQTFNFANILFQLNSAKLSRKSYGIIQDIADQLKKIDNYKLEIIGHTDTSGRAAFNKKLSRNRAKSVYTRLVALGVPAENMVAYGKGEAEPLQSNATRAGRIMNRRIEFKLRLKNVKE